MELLTSPAYSSNEMRRSVLFAALALATTFLASCSGCDKKKKAEEKRTESRECSSVVDCDDQNPCTHEECNEKECVRSYAAEGESCENETVCDGIGKCSGNGRCVSSPPPSLDDGNVCTTDECDPVEGVKHIAVVVDDDDVCTQDACDPKTGAITHDPVDLDDGDDCSFDSCDPKSGPQHKKPDAFHTCDSGCGAGFHVSSRAPSPQCRDKGGTQTFCVPDCGASFYSCDGACPTGYHASSRVTGRQCGPTATTQTFCQKDTGDSFYSCESACPEAYKKKSESTNGQCGTATNLQIFCVK
jgi:hypothetical protein